MRDVARLLGSLLTLGALLAGSPAEARMHGGGQAGPFTAPILQSVSVPFGASTPSGRGSVRLSGLDGTTTANQPQTYHGIDLWIGGNPCATWTMSFVSGRSSADYNIIAANTPEGVGAQTPNPTSTGASNASGSYVWNVTCKDVGGNSSNTVQLTYVDSAHTAIIGSTDRTDFGVTPSGFSNTTGGKIWLAVGGDFHAPAANNCCVKMNFGNGGYTNQVTITVADSSRPPYLPAFSLITANAGAGMANYRVTGLTLSGPLIANQIIAGFQTQLAGADNIQWDNIHGYFSSSYVLGTWGSGSSPAAWNASGCTTNAVACGISDSDFDYIGSGNAPLSDTYIHNVFFRHFYNNCYFFNSGTVRVDIEDGGCIAGMVATGGVHVDNCQIADGSTPSFVTMKRVLIAQGDGDTQNQGCPFRGTELSTTCYVDDGTAGHGPGVIATCPGGLLAQTNGSYFVIPGSFDYSNKVKITCASGCSFSHNVGTLSGISPTNIGSPGSPVAAYSAGGYLDWNMDGIIVSQSEPNGFGTNGEGGTSYIQDFAMFQMNATPPGEASYTGSIDNTTGVLTVTSVPTSNYPGETPCLVSCGRVWVSGVCNYCGPNIASQLTGTADGIGTYQLSSWGLGNVSLQTIKNSAGYPLADNSVGAMSQNNCGIPAIHIGTYGILNGTVQGSGSICGGSITNTTTSNWLNSGGGAAMPAANYASGMTPQTYLQALTWSSRVSAAPTLSNTDILTRNCLAVKPKIGGGLDRGSGLWLGPVTGETNSVTHTGGGNWTTNNGTDSGIPAGAVSANYPQGCVGAP